MQAERIEQYVHKVLGWWGLNSGDGPFWEKGPASNEKGPTEQRIGNACAEEARFFLLLVFLGCLVCLLVAFLCTQVQSKRQMGLGTFADVVWDVLGVGFGYISLSKRY